MQREYKHWRNVIGPGATAFVTTTCLDFNHALRRAEVKDALVRLLLDDCRRYGARPQAWVVMSHHLHLLVNLPQEHDACWFVQRIKINSANLLLPMLTEEERRGFDQQRGLNGRRFWMRSFRGLRVDSEEMMFQKIGYIHQNPVRAGLCRLPEQYRWSSAPLYARGCWGWETGLVLPDGYEGER